MPNIKVFSISSLLVNLLNSSFTEAKRAFSQYHLDGSIHLLVTDENIGTQYSIVATS